MTRRQSAKVPSGTLPPYFAPQKRHKSKVKSMSIAFFDCKVVIYGEF